MENGSMQGCSREGTPSTRTIALMNQKGGVGKTTTTVTLAAAIAEEGRTALVVDLDPQAHATLHLGVDPSNLDGSVYDLLLDPRDPESVLIELNERLALLPAETDLAAAEPELANEQGRVDRLRTALAELGDKYEFILFDCPPSLGLLTMNALAAATEVLIPMQAHFLALQGVAKLLETVGMIASSVNPSLRVAGVVLCMHDRQATHSREVVENIDAFLEEARSTDTPWNNATLYLPPIRRNIKLAECPSFGQTIFDYEPTCQGAKDYRKLARAIIDEWDASRTPAPKADVVEAPAPEPEPEPVVASPPVEVEAEAEAKPAPKRARRKAKPKPVAPEATQPDVAPEITVPEASESTEPTT